MSHLTVHDLSKQYGPVTALDSVSLSVAEGEIVCLLGPSGCGKTTLLRVIAGLTQPDAGDVRVDGQSIMATPPHARDFGMMFQDFALFPHKNVFDNVAFGLKMRGDSAEKIRDRVSEMLDLVELTRYATSSIETLSGGEQQRVALARSLAPGPRLLMLDEPLGALDRALRERLMVDLRRILKQVGVTAVYVTHDQTEAYAIADRVAVMNAGRIEQVDAPHTLYHAPATPFVARFLGFHNVVRATVGADGVVATPFGRFDLRTDREPGSTCHILVRPNALVAVHAQLPDASLLPNSVAGTVSAVTFRGRYTQLRLSGDGYDWVFECKTLPAVSPGDRVAVELDPDRVQVLDSAE